MKKIISLFLILSFFLSGCSVQQSKEDLYNEYLTAASKNAELDSYTADIAINLDMVMSDDSTVNTVSSMKIMMEGINGDTPKGSISMDVAMSGYQMTTNMYFFDGNIYVNANGETYVSAMSLSDYMSYIQSYENNLELSDETGDYIESITKESTDENTVYNIVLSDNGINSLFADTFEQEGLDINDSAISISDYTYAVTVNPDGYVSGVSLALNLVVSEDDDTTTATNMTMDINYSDFNKSQVSLPTDLSTYQVMSSQADFREWLVSDDGFTEITSGIYQQIYDETQTFYFNFNNDSYTLEYDGVSYEIYYVEQVGKVNSCVYDFSTENGTDCSDDEINILTYTVQCLAYDLQLANVSIADIQ